MLSSIRNIRQCGRGSSRLLVRLVTEDRGQDLVEYALLAAFIGIAGWVVLMTLPEAIGETYKSWLDPNNTNSVPGQWNPPEPSGS